MIIVDDREVKSGICDELLKLNVDFKINRLEIGDYIINDKIYIERKTTEDFLLSMKDRRLFSQIARLRAGNKRAAMIVEGEKLSGGNSVKAALCSIAIQWYMPVIRSVNLPTTAQMLKIINSFSRNKCRAKHDYQFIPKRRISSLQKRMLMQMKYIGPELADRLLEKFGSINNIINATDKELREVHGIGELIIKEIRLLK